MNKTLDQILARAPKLYKILTLSITSFFFINLFSRLCWADSKILLPSLNLGIQASADPQKLNTSLQILFLITILSLAPSILVMVTSFTRIVIVLSFIRQAVGTRMAPPNQLLVGFALFLTFFVMSPIFIKINTQALQPYFAGKISQTEAFKAAVDPLRVFMFKQTRKKDLALFVKLAKVEHPKNENDIPTHVLIPSFIISELRTSFQMGFALFIPFLLIDLVIASLLMSMGMMMLPPIMISLPFKILLFILADGWNLIVHSLVMSFN